MPENEGTANVAEVATEVTKKSGKGGLIIGLVLAGTALAGAALYEGGKRIFHAIKGRIEARKAAKNSEDSGETQN